jgi:hypothetical protein
MKKIFFLFLVLPLIATTCRDLNGISINNKTSSRVYYSAGFFVNIADTVNARNPPATDFLFLDYMQGNKQAAADLKPYRDNLKDHFFIVFWVDSITKSRYSNQEIMQRRLYSLDIYTAPELINADYTINYPR